MRCNIEKIMSVGGGSINCRRRFEWFPEIENKICQHVGLQKKIVRYLIGGDNPAYFMV